MHLNTTLHARCAIAFLDVHTHSSAVYMYRTYSTFTCLSKQIIYIYKDNSYTFSEISEEDARKDVCATCGTTETATAKDLEIRPHGVCGLYGNI